MIILDRGIVTSHDSAAEEENDTIKSSTPDCCKMWTDREIYLTESCYIVVGTLIIL